MAQCGTDCLSQHNSKGFSGKGVKSTKMSTEGDIWGMSVVSLITACSSVTEPYFFYLWGPTICGFAKIKPNLIKFPPLWALQGAQNGQSGPSIFLLFLCFVPQWVLQRKQAQLVLWLRKGLSLADSWLKLGWCLADSWLTDSWLTDSWLTDSWLTS